MPKLPKDQGQSLHQPNREAGERDKTIEGLGGGEKPARKEQIQTQNLLCLGFWTCEMERERESGGATKAGPKQEEQSTGSDENMPPLDYSEGALNLTQFVRTNRYGHTHCPSMQDSCVCYQPTSRGESCERADPPLGDDTEPGVGLLAAGAKSPHLRLRGLLLP